MGDVIDLLEFKARSTYTRTEAQQSDGAYLQTISPFIILKHYEAGTVRGEQRLISERLLREYLDTL